MSIGNDQELTDLINKKFPELTTSYRIGKKEVSPAKAKARIKYAKTKEQLEELKVTGDPELEELYTGRAQEFKIAEKKVLSEEDKSHNRLVNLIKNYNTSSATQRKRFDTSNIMKMAKDLGYNAKMDKGKLNVTRDGRTIGLRTERISTAEKEAHKAFEEYEEPFKEKANKMLVPAFMEGVEVGIGPSEVNQAILDIQAGKKSVNANKLLDEIENIQGDGKVRIKADPKTGFTGAEVALDEYLDLINDDITPEDEAIMQQIPDEVYDEMAKEETDLEQYLNYIPDETREEKRIVPEIEKPEKVEEITETTKEIKDKITTDTDGTERQPDIEPSVEVAPEKPEARPDKVLKEAESRDKPVSELESLSKDVTNEKLGEQLDKIFNATGKYPEKGIEYRGVLNKMITDGLYGSQRVNKSLQKDAENLLDAIIAGNEIVIKNVQDKHFKAFQTGQLVGKTRDRFIRTDNARIDLYNKAFTVGVEINKIKKGLSEIKEEKVKPLKQAEKDVDTSPSEAQIEAGNYAKGHTRIQGMDITIENPKGSTRKGTDESGKKWSVELKNSYGYFKKTTGKDGDQIDVFIGPNPEKGKVFIVDQVNTDGSFDEHKAVVGVDNIDEAEKAYLSNYSKGWKGMGAITEVPIDTFKEWIGDGKRKRKAYSEYVGVKEKELSSSERIRKRGAERNLKEIRERGFMTVVEPQKIIDKIKKYTDTDIELIIEGKDVKIKDQKDRIIVEKPEKKELDPRFKDDIPYKTAYNAYAGISFDPEKRAEMEQRSYSEAMSSFYDELSEDIINEDQQKILDDEFETYKSGYLNKYLSYLGAKSRTLSPMITGPARFPTARNEKAFNSERNHYERFFEWNKRAKKAVRKKIAEVLTPEQISDKRKIKVAEQATGIKKDIDFLLNGLKAEKEGKVFEYDKDLLKNPIGVKIANIAFSDIELAEELLEYTTEKEQELGLKPLFTKRNIVYKSIERAKEQRDNPPEIKEFKDNVLIDRDGIKVVDEQADERIRLYFDDIPSQEIRDYLKSRGWRWSPFNKAWQRKNTDNAKLATEIFSDKYFPEVSKEEPKPKTISEVSSVEELQELLAEGKVKKDKAFDERMEQLRSQEKGVMFKEEPLKKPTDFETPQEYFDYYRESKKSEREKIKAFSEDLATKLGTKVNVVDFFGDLPQNVRKSLKSRKAADVGGVLGVYNPVNDEVYIISEPMRGNTVKATRAVLHEVVGHKGIRGLLGEKLDPVLKNVWDGMSKSDQEAYLKNYGDQNTASEEYLAEKAEPGKNPTFIQQAISKIRDLIRKLFPNLKYNNADVLGLIKKSREFVKKGKITPEVEQKDRVSEPEKGEVTSIKTKAEDQTKTPEFKKWFGNSKIVDEKGEPLVVYHGTDAEFTEFDLSLVGTGSFTGNPISKAGIWFSPDKGYAESYTGEEGEIMPVFLSINKPYITSFNELNIKLQKEGEINLDEERTKLFINKIKKSHDSLIIKKGDEVREIAVFSPTQIKSATGNVGLFDPSNPDIRLKVEQAQEGQKQVNTFSDKAREILQDRQLALKNWLNSLKESGIKIRDFENPYQKENLSHGKILKKSNDFADNQGKSLVDAVSSFIKGTDLNVKDVQNYLVAKHGPERNEYFWEKVPARVGEDFSGLTELKNKYLSELSKTDKREALKLAQYGINEFAEYFAATIEAKTGKVKVVNLHKAVSNATDYTLKEWKDSGFLSKDAYDEIKSRYEYYVPLRGWEVTDDFDYASTVGNYNNPVIAAKGRKSLSDDPLGYIMNMGNSAIISGERNRIKQSMGNLVRNNREELESQVKFKKTYFVQTDQYENGEKVVYETIDRPEQKLFDEGRVSIKIPTKYKERKTSGQAKEFEVEFYENGEKMVLVFEGTDPAVPRAIENREANLNYDWANKAISNSIGRGTRYLSSVLTSLNPSFAIPNMMRDIPLAIISEWVEGDTKDAGTLFVNLQKAEGAVRRDLRGKPNLSNPIDKHYQNFLKSGGATGFVHLKSVDKFKKEILRDIKNINKETNPAVVMGKGFQTGIKYIEQLSEWSENISRFAVYLNHINKGESSEQAASAAKNSTVNFNRKGRLSPTLNGLFAFFNAGVQAIDKYFKLWGTNWGKMAAVHAVLPVQGFIMAMLLDLFGDEDDEGIRRYDKVNDFIKKNYLVIPIPYTDRTTTIPMPHVFRKFHGMGVDAYNLMTNRKTSRQVMIEQFANLPQDILPIDVGGILDSKGDLSIKPITPTLFKPLIEIIMNENFMRYPITPEPYTMGQMRQIADTRRYRKNTNKAARWITDQLYHWGGGDETGLKMILKDGELKQIPALLDISPTTLEFLAESYTGGTGKFFNQIYKTADNIFSASKEYARGKEFKEAVKEIDLNMVPVVNRFIRQPWGDPLREKYFEAKRDLDDKTTILKEYENLYKDKYSAYLADRTDESKEAYEQAEERYFDAQNDLGLDLKNYKSYEGIIDKLNENYRRLISAKEDEDAEELNKERRKYMKEIIDIYQNK